MTITVRLSSDESRRLEEACRRLGKKRSAVVREALALLEDRLESRETAAERLAPWLGAWDSGGKNYSVDTRKKVAALIRSAHERKRSR